MQRPPSRGSGVPRGAVPGGQAGPGHALTERLWRGEERGPEAPYVRDERWIAALLCLEGVGWILFSHDQSLCLLLSPLPWSSRAGTVWHVAPGKKAISIMITFAFYVKEHEKKRKKIISSRHLMSTKTVYRH